MQLPGLAQSISEISNKARNNKLSPDDVKESVKSIIKDKELVININQVTFNKINKFITTSVKIEWQNVIKTFEGFRYKG